MEGNKVNPLIGANDEDNTEEENDSSDNIKIVSSLCIAQLANGKIELVQMRGAPEPDLDTLSKMAMYFFTQAMSACVADNVGQIIHRELPGMVKRILSETNSKNHFGHIVPPSSGDAEDMKN